MTQTPADQLRTAAAKLRPSSPPGAAHTVAVRLAPGIVDAAADLLDAAARMATAYPEMAHDHDRPACDDYACDLMGAALAVARQILGTTTTETEACSRCKGSGVDPENCATEQYGDGQDRRLPEPCSACQFSNPAVLPAILREAATLLVDHASTLEALSTSDYDKESFAASHLRTKAVDLHRLADGSVADAPCGRPASMTAPCSAGDHCCKGTGEAQQPVLCICGHPEPQHFEDVCQTCGCGDYLEPEDASSLIDRWRQEALTKRDVRRAAVLREAIRRVENREERAKTSTGGGLGWESARDVLRRMLDEAQQPAPAEAETCRPVTIDGEVFRVRGAREMSDDARAALADVIRAVKRRNAAEQPHAAAGVQPPTESEADTVRDRIEDALVRMDAMVWLGCRRGDRDHDEPIGVTTLAARLAEAVTIPPAASAGAEEPSL